jgi:hypothetical protein
MRRNKGFDFEFTATIGGKANLQLLGADERPSNVRAATMSRRLDSRRGWRPITFHRTQVSSVFSAMSSLRGGLDHGMAIRGRTANPRMASRCPPGALKTVRSVQHRPRCQTPGNGCISGCIACALTDINNLDPRSSILNPSTSRTTHSILAEHAPMPANW